MLPIPKCVVVRYVKGLNKKESMSILIRRKKALIIVRAIESPLIVALFLAVGVFLYFGILNPSISIIIIIATKMKNPSKSSVKVLFTL